MYVAALIYHKRWHATALQQNLFLFLHVALAKCKSWPISHVHRQPDALLRMVIFLPVCRVEMVKLRFVFFFSYSDRTWLLSVKLSHIPSYSGHHEIVYVVGPISDRFEWSMQTNLTTFQNSLHHKELELLANLNLQFANKMASIIELLFYLKCTTEFSSMWFRSSNVCSLDCAIWVYAVPKVGRKGGEEGWNEVGVCVCRFVYLANGATQERPKTTIEWWRRWCSIESIINIDSDMKFIV